jgi:uncharacterized membrane protein
MSTNEQGDSNKKLYCILSYVFILWLIGLVQMPQDPDVKFHVNQGIVLSIAGVIVSVLGSAIPFVGWFIIAPIGGILILILCIMGIIAANNNEQKELPVIGKIKILK